MEKERNTERVWEGSEEPGLKDLRDRRRSSQRRPSQICCDDYFNYPLINIDET